MGCCPVPGSWSPWSPGVAALSPVGGGPSGATAAARPLPPLRGLLRARRQRGHATVPGTATVCPVSGAWGPWGPWVPARARAGARVRVRVRGRFGAAAAAAIPRSHRETPPGPPARGAPPTASPARAAPLPRGRCLGAWSPATPCPVTCGLGGVVLSRACDAPSPKYGGRGCEGPQTRRGLCGPRDPCPESPHWGPWGPWSPQCPCVSPCPRRVPALGSLGPWSPCRRPWGDISCRSLAGQQRRTRECAGHSAGGAACPTHGGASTIELRACYSVNNCLRESPMDTL
ncbi:properdin-like [Catharus ustulatus]|uniref:properdin-like n=1 Tax=Catharus ustulatus TaxID=91951 RepID=UPI001409A7F2|nr:properdin-like [Catharus ustulatus]